MAATLIIRLCPRQATARHHKRRIVVGRPPESQPDSVRLDAVLARNDVIGVDFSPRPGADHRCLRRIKLYRKTEKMAIATRACSKVSARWIGVLRTPYTISTWIQYTNRDATPNSRIGDRCHRL